MCQKLTLIAFSLALPHRIGELNSENVVVEILGMTLSCHVVFGSFEIFFWCVVQFNDRWFLFTQRTGRADVWFTLPYFGMLRWKWAPWKISGLIPWRIISPSNASQRVDSSAGKYNNCYFTIQLNLIQNIASKNCRSSSCCSIPLIQFRTGYHLFTISWIWRHQYC